MEDRWNGMTPSEYDKYCEKHGGPPPTKKTEFSYPEVEYVEERPTMRQCYETVFDTFRNEMRPQPDKCLTKQEAWKLPYKARINVMFRGNSYPIRFEVVGKVHELYLKNLVSGELIHASEIFDKLGNDYGCHVAWRTW